MNRGFIMRDSEEHPALDAGMVVADRYEILRRIGKGGMGEVFLAADRNTGRKVALKTLHAKYSRNMNAVARFIREVRLARRLNHPGIVKIFDARQWEGTLFYTMEYVEGKSVRHWLRQRGKLDFGSTVRILCLVADALEHAHKITIHRDLSPENVMVLRDGSVRLLDFGLAKLDDEFRGLTLVGVNLGKLKYMAPEQRLNAAAVNHRADLYSLGVMFFEMLAGRLPEDNEKISRACPGLPRNADDFMARATAQNPADRFSSARELRDDLLRLYKEPAKRPSPADRLREFAGFLRGLFRRGRGRS